MTCLRNASKLGYIFSHHSQNIINAQKQTPPLLSLSYTLNNQKLSLGATFLPSPHSTANTARGFVLASPMAPFRSS